MISEEIIKKAAQYAAEDVIMIDIRLLKLLNKPYLWDRYPTFWEELSNFFEESCQQYKRAAHEIGEINSNGGKENINYPLTKIIGNVKDFCLKCRYIAAKAYSYENFSNPKLTYEQTKVKGHRYSVTEWLNVNCSILHDATYNLANLLMEYYLKSK